MFKKFRMPLFLAALIVLGAAALSGCAATRASGADAAPTAAPSGPAQASEATAAAAQGTLVIPLAELTGDARIYPADVDGVRVEVVAVKASDGSARTAFNACQVCYDSGRGYYKQEGNVLVCQNCGNRFSMDQLGLSAGGCNPVPIGEELRAEDGESIAISMDILKQGKPLFEYRKD